MVSSLFIKILKNLNAGVTQLARVTAFQAVGRGFESRLPLENRVRNLSLKLKVPRVRRSQNFFGSTKADLPLRN